MYYVPAANALYLFNDTTSVAAGPLTPGGSGSLSNNSQCTISGTGFFLSGTGNTLALTLGVVFSSSFKGHTQSVYGYATDNSNLNSG